MTALPAPIMPQTPVTILDVYTKQVELAASLAVIHEQLKAIPDHEGRIRRLEEARSKLYGAAAILSLFFSGLGTWIGIALSHR